ncbi:tocopherol cyclase family protein [Synechocystis sp. PCC 7509]|uniref:tocopherol cyclase family protein n=1 Tax=Synechocystis sp. PCC 7509 TaxID=927677 RepID=UPI0002ACD40A|nr:tocopherol cyclase family protein [Synechocystis sp. PCC 7509]
MFSIPDKKLLQQTPHSGYQWDNSDRRFFEGWYYRVTLPEINLPFAFMYSIEDPTGGKPHSGDRTQQLNVANLVNERVISKLMYKKL